MKIFGPLKVKGGGGVVTGHSVYTDICRLDYSFSQQKASFLCFKNLIYTEKGYKGS